MNNSNIQWRNSALDARLGLGFMSVDARACLPILGVIFHLSWLTFYIFVGVMVFFALLENMGYRLPVAIRKARNLVSGKSRYVHRTTQRRRRLIHA